MITVRNIAIEIDHHITPYFRQASQEITSTRADAARTGPHARFRDASGGRTASATPSSAQAAGRRRAQRATSRL